MTKDLIDIWEKTKLHKKEITVVYLIQLLFGIVAAVTTWITINSVMGRSAALERLADGFDRTVLMDAIYQNADTLGPLKTTFGILIPIYLLISIILHGGLLSNISRGHRTISEMCNAGLRFVIPFAGIALLTLVSAFGVIGLIALAFGKSVGDPLQTFYSEKPFVWWLIALISIALFWFGLVWSWSVGARYSYIEQGRFSTALKYGLSFVKNNFMTLVAVTSLLLGISLLLGFLYNMVMGDRGASTWMIVILGIMLQQIIAYCRVYLRGIAYVTLGRL